MLTIAGKVNLFLIGTEDFGWSFEERDEAQYLLDGLTIKHVHLKTGTLAFLIQHCYGLRGPNRRMNALLA